MTIDISPRFTKMQNSCRPVLKFKSVHCKEVALFSQALANFARDIKSYDPARLGNNLITVRHLHKLLLTTPLSLSTLLERKRDVLNDFWLKLMAAKAGVPNVSVAYELLLEALEFVEGTKNQSSGGRRSEVVASVGATTTVSLAIPKASFMDPCRVPFLNARRN